eukprot:365687-Chlamydomonas_euryale.AAC.14
MRRACSVCCVAARRVWIVDVVRREAVEAAATALQVGALRGVDKSSTLVLMDRNGGSAQQVAREMARRGYGKGCGGACSKRGSRRCGIACVEMKRCEKQVWETGVGRPVAQKEQQRVSGST